MQPRSPSVSPWRWLSVAAASAGILAVGTMVPGSTALEESPAPAVQRAEVLRPSYISALPDLTARELDAGRIVASAVAVAPQPVEIAPVAEATLSAAAVPETAPEPEPEMFVVTANGLNVRAGPSSADAPLFVLKEGAEVAIAQMEGNWARVTSAAGETGWAYAKYLAPSRRE